MKLSKLLWISAILSILIVASCSKISDNDDNIYFVRTDGKVDAYICPRNNCTEIYGNLITNSTGDIKCALFDIGDKIKGYLLSEERRGRSIKAVVDENNADNFKGLNNIIIRKGYGLMHNKFCIIGDVTLTGSTNPTYNGLNKNNNNLLLIDSPRIASLYRDEFSRLYYGSTKDMHSSRYLLNKSEIRILFCPKDRCAEKVSREIEGAKRSVYFMIFSFTHPKIANAILLAHDRNVDIKGVMESRQISDNSYYNLFKYQGVDVMKDKNKANMHHKVFIIDNSTVIAGSFNPTKSGDMRNDENIIIIKDRRTAKVFLDEFNRLRSRWYGGE